VLFKEQKKTKDGIRFGSFFGAEQNSQEKKNRACMCPMSSTLPSVRPYLGMSLSADVLKHLAEAAFSKVSLGRHSRLGCAATLFLEGNPQRVEEIIILDEQAVRCAVLY